MAEKPPASDEDRIYISELAQIINREVGTIRKWESQGKLPKRLLPKRGYRDWRYWTPAQVNGENGIIAWMKKNDMRPGNLLTDPSHEAEHIAALRRPKYLNGHHINSAKKMAENGRSAEYILRKLFPRTKYSSVENLERALRKYFKSQGLEFPKLST